MLAKVSQSLCRETDDVAGGLVSHIHRSVYCVVWHVCTRPRAAMVVARMFGSSASKSNEFGIVMVSM